MKRGIVALFALIMLISCGGNATSKSSDKSSSSADTKSIADDAVEVLYFHGKKRCVTCNAIEVGAAEVVRSLADAKVVMRSVDFSTAEGEQIADKYEIASSSLILVKGGKVDNITTMAFKNGRSNPELFKKSLGELIQNMLK